MPSFIRESRWLNRFRNEPSDLDPLFEGWRGEIDPQGLSNQLRAAFAFLRRHGEGRYSAQSLMRLMDAADKLDEVLDSGAPFDGTTVPAVAIAGVPYTYDEETEVKCGGIVGVAVVLPDGRLMMAVHTNTRRERVGGALYAFAREFLISNPIVWVHQANITAAQFCLMVGLQPREVNSRGAVAWSESVIRNDDVDFAVAQSEDWEVDDALRRSQQQRRRQARRPQRVPRDRRPTPDYGYDDVYDDRDPELV